MITTEVSYGRETYSISKSGTESEVQSATKLATGSVVTPINPSPINYKPEVTALSVDYKSQFVPRQPYIPEYRFSKQKKSTYTNVNESKKSLNLEVTPVSDTKEFRIQNEQLYKAFHKYNQSGYQTDRSYETIVAGQDPMYAKQVKESLKVPKGTHITAETINTQKNTYRSGYQTQAPPGITSDLQQIRKEVGLPYPVRNKGIYGDSNGANGHNGWSRQKLYVANYRNIDGVGSF